MTTTVHEVPANTAATAPVDLYREIHKALRRAIFELVGRAGSLDPTDTTEVESFRALFSDMDMMLDTHHRHEDSADLGELIAQHGAGVASIVSAGHDRAEQQWDVLRSAVAALGDAASADDLYDRLVVFTADYLDHMQVEEKEVMPRLQANATPEELGAVLMAIRTSVPPPDMCVFLRSMLPAMNPDERATTLGGMFAGAPPEVFEQFWNVAEETLSPSAVGTIADRIGK